MSRRLRLDSLRAELASVEALLEEARDADDPVGVVQYGQRRDDLLGEIEELEEKPATSASVALLFGGKPVIGSEGIAADFAGAVLEKFQDLVSRFYASAEYGALGRRGPVPLKSQTQLMVTELARGSFGFVLDEFSEQADLDKTALKFLVEEMDQIVEDTASPNEPDFEAVLDRLDARTLTALRDFFIELDSNDASLRVVDDQRDFLLDEPAIDRARYRTEATLIEEAETDLSGLLIGFLPEHKKFELKLEDGTTIYGSVSKAASEQFQSLVFAERDPVGKKWTLKLNKRTVTPLRRPPRDVFYLLEFQESQSESA